MLMDEKVAGPQSSRRSFLATLIFAGAAYAAPTLVTVNAARADSRPSYRSGPSKRSRPSRPSRPSRGSRPSR